jgi:hypothetical protein
VLKSAREFSKCNATHIELKLFVVKLKIGLYLIKRFRNEISNNAGKLARFIKEPDITGFYACKFTLTKKKFSCFWNSVQKQRIDADSCNNCQQIESRHRTVQSGLFNAAL